MNVTILIGDREAIPVRALPFVTGWMATPSALAQELAGENGKPRFTAYRVNGGEPTLIKPQSWGIVLDLINDLTRALKKQEIEPNENRQVGRREAVEKLPRGVFCWLDEFTHWFGSTYFATDTIWEEQHQVVGEDDDATPLFIPGRNGNPLDLAPILQGEEKSMVMHGFERYFEAGNSSPAFSETLPLLTVTATESLGARTGALAALFNPAANAESKAPPVTPAAALTGLQQQGSGVASVPSENKPWLIQDPRDPVPEDFQPWYTAARFFARELVALDSTLLVKRDVLAQKVSVFLAKADLYKRGKKKQPLDPVTIKKAFSNVVLS